MVFPSLSFSVETGLISQMSTIAVIAFSIAINYWKKITVYIAIIAGVGLFSTQAFSIAMIPGGCGTSCMANQNYYGAPWGYNRPVYYYPQLQYHSFWGPTPQYFRPHNQSPYAPSWYNNCPTCNQGGNGWNTIMPMNNNTNQQQYHGPGMPMS